MKYNRPTVAEISFANLKHNYNEIKNRIGDDVAVMGVVKANAYGHGSVEISRELIKYGVEYLAVASVDEAYELRQAGIVAPVLVLGHSAWADDMIIEHDISYSIYSYDQAVKMNEVYKNNNKTAVCHILCDTGMSRLGFKGIDETVTAVKKIKELSNIRLEGIFSHFAFSDSEFMDYTFEQLTKFEKILSKLEENNINFKYIHTANSGGVINYKDSYFNMVRPGISMYGYYPSDNDSGMCLKPVMSLKSKITQVKDIFKGEYVGYSCTYKAHSDIKIAIVPIGYGDGYHRLLSGIGEVYIKGQKAKVVGRVCMDQIMVDVTDIENVVYNDKVIIFDEKHSASIIAKQCYTIDYEIITNISKRIPRIYY